MFIDNVCTQAVERHFMRGIEEMVPGNSEDMEEGRFERLIENDPRVEMARKKLLDNITKLEMGLDIAQNWLK
jgi:hypothetical protein